jgi:hypothetical protein
MSIGSFTCVAILAVLAVAVHSQQPSVGAYVLLSRVARNSEPVGLQELQMLADQAASLPVNRLWFSFFAPTLVYYPGSYTLAHARLNVSKSGDFGFVAIKQAIEKIQVRFFLCEFCFAGVLHVLVCKSFPARRPTSASI